MAPSPHREDGLQPSEELRAITARWFEAIARADADAALARFSRDRAMTYWGTDAGEFVDDPDQLARYIRAAFSDETMGSWGAPPYRIDAWADGRLGWSTTHSTIRFPPGAQELRGTLVFRLELDEWKIVHEHWSFGASEEIYGYPAGSTLDLISQAAQEERPDLRPWTAQDGTTTLVFTDIEGSTALNAAFGDQAWLEVLRVHNQIVEREVRNHGGAVVKGQGDGFMLAFASARRALSCAEAIQRAMQEAFTDPGSPIRVRIGVHTGEVIREANDFFGHAVNYAARVASHAKGGQILVSTIVHDLVEPSRAFSFEMPQQVELKGIDGPVRLWRLGPRIGRGLAPAGVRDRHHGGGVARLDDPGGRIVVGVALLIAR